MGIEAQYDDVTWVIDVCESVEQLAGSKQLPADKQLRARWQVADLSFHHKVSTSN